MTPPTEGPDTTHGRADDTPPMSERSGRAAAELGQRRLAEIADVVDRSDDAHGALERAAPLIAHATAARTVVLALAAPSPARSNAWRRADVPARDVRRARGHALRWCQYLAGDGGWVASELDRADAAPRLGRAGARARRRASHALTLPLIVRDGQVLGALHIDTDGAIGEPEVLFLGQVASLFAAVVARREPTGEAGNAVDRKGNHAQRTSAGVDVVAEGVITVDVAGVMNHANATAERMLGWRGQPPLDVELHASLVFHSLGGALIEPDASPLTRALRDGERVRGEDCLLTSTRRGPLPVRLTVEPLRSRGQVIGALLTFQDIAAVRRSERFQRFLALSAAALATSLDRAETIASIARLPVPVLADACFLDLVGDEGTLERSVVHVAGDLAARRAWSMVRTGDPVRETPQAQSWRLGESILCSDVDGYVLRDVSSDAPASMESLAISSMAVIPLRARSRLLGTFTFAMIDSHRRLTGAALPDLEEVAARAAMAIENATMFGREQLATRAREDILAVVSHDLRNPLAVVLGGASLLLTRALDEERSVRTMLAIQRAALRMRRLVADLLDASSIDGGHLSIEIARQPVASLLDEAVDIAAESVPAKRRLVLRSLPQGVGDAMVVCDRDRILQVFSNLIGNAIKFTPDGGTIEVGAAPGDGEVVFSVADTGPGIAAEHLPHVFERFWQLRRTGATRGLGLGLSITRGIVETHGGRLWVESAEGRGATFYFTLHAVVVPA